MAQHIIPPTSLPLLRYSRAESAKRISEQIKRAKSVYDLLWSDSEEARWHGRQSVAPGWHNSTRTLLRSLFTNDELSARYFNTVLSQPPGRREEEVLGEGVEFLRRIKDELPHYDEFEPTADPRQQIGLSNLHPLIVKRCRDAFERDAYDHAIQDALKLIETELRRRGKATDGDYGTDLVSKVLGGPNPRIKIGKVPAEQDAAHMLYRGAIGLLKNPQSHRFLDTDDPIRAVEILAFASLLLRILDEATQPESLAQAIHQP